MLVDRDITAEVEFGDSDGESLPLTRCACGKKYDFYDCVLSIYRDMPTSCACGRQLYFSNRITVYEIGNDCPEGALPRVNAREPLHGS